MADFASIYQNAFKPTVPLQDTTDAISKALQMKGMQQQQQIRQQEMQDAADFKAQYGVTPGMAQARQKMQLGEKEVQDAESKRQKSHFEAAEALADQQASVYDWGRKMLERNPDKAPDIHAEVLRRTMQNAKTIFPTMDFSKTDDPASFAVPAHPTEGDPTAPPMWDTQAQKAWLDNQIAKIPETKKMIESKKLALETRKQDWAENKPDKESVGAIEKDLATYNRSLTSPVGPNDPGFKRWFREMHPSSSSIISTGPGTGFDPSKPLSPAEESEAKARAKSGERLTPSARNPGVALRINSRSDWWAEQEGTNLADVKQNRKLQFQALSDFEGKGQANVTIRALNTMTEHVDTARRMASALDSGDIPLFNKLGQALAKASGKPAPTNFDTLREFLAGEVAKVAAGGHLTEGEIKSAADKLNKAQSPAQMTGALDTMAEVAGGKLVALDQDYKRVSRGGKSLGEDNRLTPATLRAFNDVRKRQGGGAEAPANQGTKPLPQSMIGTLPPKVAQDYLAGKKVKGPDGTIYQKGN